MHVLAGCAMVPATIRSRFRKDIACLLLNHSTVYYVGDVGPNLHFCYTDERDLCGMYVEHVWFAPEAEAAINSQIPRYYSRRNAPA